MTNSVVSHTTQPSIYCQNVSANDQKKVLLHNITSFISVQLLLQLLLFISRSSKFYPSTLKNEIQTHEKKQQQTKPDDFNQKYTFYL